MHVYLTRRDKIIIGASIGVVALFIVLLAGLIHHKKSNSVSNLIVNELTILNTGIDVPEYAKDNITKDVYEEFIADTAGTGFTSYEDFMSKTDTLMGQQSSQISATGANRDLYLAADQYFICYYGSQRLSPVFPMALSNVETPGRADNSITWSALFPSKIISVDQMLTADVTTVISDPKIFGPLSREVSTRDRGALQMSPTYGTGNDSINKQMSGTEQEKLSRVASDSYASWVGGASKEPGDRFFLPDVCRRLSAAMSQSISYMLKNDYVPVNDVQLVVMCAMSHHNSGVWYYKDRARPIGRWNSAGAAYELSQKLSTPEFVDVISKYARESDKLYIDTNIAKKLWEQAYPDIDINQYSGNSTVYSYPIKALYAYLKLCYLYTQ